MNINNKKLDINKLGFCMITPDAFIRKKEDELLKFLIDKGFSFLDFKFNYVNEQIIEEIYKYTYLEKIEEHKKTHWWLTKKPYNENTALGLVVYLPNIPKGFASVSEYIKSFKGPSDFTNRQEGSVRKIFDSFSKTLALFHSSDNTISMEREANLFFGCDIIQKININKTFSMNYISESLQNNFEEKDINPIHALYLLKLRIAYFIDKNINKSIFWETHGNCLIKSYRATLNLFQTCLNYDKCYEILDSIETKERIILLAQKNDIICDNAEIDDVFIKGLLIKLIEFLKMLSDTKKIRCDDLFEFISIVRFSGIKLTRWEEILILNLLFFRSDI